MIKEIKIIDFELGEVIIKKNTDYNKLGKTFKKRILEANRRKEPAK